MATKKPARKSTTKTTPKRAASSTTRVRTVSAKDVPSRNVATATGTTTARKIDNNIINIVLAELVGTFILTMVALLAVQNVMPLFVGLTLALLVMTIGAVSGSHVNPAVTFGLWAARKLNTIMVPFYWLAQFVGAMAAILLINVVAGANMGLDFVGHFAEFSWNVMAIELIGTAIFLFGLVSVTNRNDLSAGGKALGVGLSLFVGILVATSVLTPAQSQAISDYQKSSSATKEQETAEIPHLIYVKGATLNPAVALATSESTQSELTGAQAGDDETAYSRLSLEVIIGTLVGAALGANLALLVAYRFRD